LFKFCFLRTVQPHCKQRSGLGEKLAVAIRQPKTWTKDKKELQRFNNFRRPVFCQTNVASGLF